MEEWKVKGDIFLSCDENFGFGVYLMENYGRNQTILSGTANIQKNWDEDLEITACAARESTFYIIMTKDTKEYHGKPQKWFVHKKWKQVNDDIQEGYKDGKAMHYGNMLLNWPEAVLCCDDRNTGEVELQVV